MSSKYRLETHTSIKFTINIEPGLVSSVSEHGVGDMVFTLIWVLKALATSFNGYKTGRVATITVDPKIRQMGAWGFTITRIVPSRPVSNHFFNCDALGGIHSYAEIGGKIRVCDTGVILEIMQAIELHLRKQQRYTVTLLLKQGDQSRDDRAR